DEGEQNVRHLQGMPRPVPQAQGRQEKEIRARIVSNQATAAPKMASTMRAVVVMLLVLSGGLPSAGAAELAPRVASYTIDAALEPDTHAVSGSAVVQWRNTSRVPATELYVHLYLNAFANNRTTLMTGMREDAQRFLSRYADPWGSIDLATIYIGDRNVV